jgi:hypothetical protein
MSLPGFTAEGSLYRSGQYQMSPAQRQIQGTVYPARLSTEGCATYQECCEPDSFGCLSCRQTDEVGTVVDFWSVCPPCEPSSTWKWDAQGCKAWTIVHEDCSVENPVDCGRPVTPPNRGSRTPVFLSR